MTSYSMTLLGCVALATVSLCQGKALVGEIKFEMGMTPKCIDIRVS
jgi:hypothetical protein